MFVPVQSHDLDFQRHMSWYVAGADPGFEVREGALKKMNIRS